MGEFLVESTPLRSLLELGRFSLVNEMAMYMNDEFPNDEWIVAEFAKIQPDELLRAV